MCYGSDTPYAHLETIPDPYTILSHTCIDSKEVTYDELVTGTGKNKPSYDKIRFYAEKVAQHRLQYFWADTCCINKSKLPRIRSVTAGRSGTQGGEVRFWEKREIFYFSIGKVVKSIFYP